MRVNFVGHACLLADLNGVRVLSDPWWKGPCFGAQWWVYPTPDTSPVAAGKIDYVYISHGHSDHLHLSTLKSIGGTFRVLVSSTLSLAASLRKEGFDVLEIAPDQVLDLGDGASCRIWPTHGDDTLIILSDGVETCVNANDALHAAPAEVRDTFVARLRSEYQVDYFFCGYGTASHFPNCYSVPGKRNAESAARRQHVFNERWVGLVAALQPRYAFPFAADVVLLEDDMFWANEPVHNSERPTDLYRSMHPASAVQVFDIAPGFEISGGTVTKEKLWAPLQGDALRAAYAAQITRANNYGPVTGEVVAEICGLLAKNIVRLAGYLESFPKDYRCLIRFRACAAGIELRKSGTRVTAEQVVVDDASVAQYDLVYTTRAHYVRNSLTTEFGHEILWVGSGGVFRYARQQDVATRLHRELIALTRNYDFEPVPVRAPAPGVVYRAKQLVKRLLGRKEVDLYDLNVWTVYGAGDVS